MVKKLIITLITILALSIPSPASAHYDHWHQATCNTVYPRALWYYIPSTGGRVTYWNYIDGYVDVDQPLLQTYAEQGYECGWLRHVTRRAVIEWVCQFDYCGQGITQNFAGGYLAMHYGGWAAGYVVAHGW